LNRLNVVFQVALSLVLLVGAGLFLRTLQNLRTLDAGFDRENVLQFSSNPGSGFSRPQLLLLHQEILARLEGLPGVISGTFSGNGMLAGAMRTGGFQIDGYTRAPNENMTANILFVAPKFFETVGLPLTVGRGITAADENSKVVVINETLANRYFSGRTPIGQYLRRGNQGDFEIIGVARDAKYLSLREPSTSAVYAPFSVDASPINAFALRTEGDRSALAAAIRQVAKEINPRILVSDLRTMGDVADATIVQERLTAKIAAFCSLLAVFLACLGLFGVLSYHVARRTKEIAIHMALGARPRQIVRAVMRETAMMIGSGLVLGLLGALAATRIVSTLLFGVSSTDAVTMITAVLTLVAAAAIAGYLPARRAARVDPLAALRHE
jgi:predicted permease